MKFIFDEETKGEVVSYLLGLDPAKKYKLEVKPYAEIDEDLTDGAGTGYEVKPWPRVVYDLPRRDQFCGTVRAPRKSDCKKCGD
jgi:hypothetical protein